jgi:hypothetical protein
LQLQVGNLRFTHMQEGRVMVSTDDVRQNSNELTLMLLLLLLQGDHGVLHQHDVGHTGAAQHMAAHQRAAAKVRAAG